jgi:hypothetical protein
LKKKINTYILVLAVLLVWGVVIYKFFSSTTVLENNRSAGFTNKEVKKIVEDSIQNFEIKTNYRDPFLGVIRVRSKPRKKKEIIVKKTVRFPKIQYSGIISAGAKTTYIIKINNAQYFYKLSDTNKEVRLLSGDKEKIEVQYKDEAKTYFFKK